jgi:Fe-S-cluster-containing hydrogenase component 2
MVIFEEQACAAGQRAHEGNCNMDVQKSGVIVYSPDKCAACGVCEVMCSLWHEGVTGTAFAGCTVVPNPFTATHSFIICSQCDSPDCYFACPIKDIALCIDRATGARYIDADECTGCMMCIDACPLETPGIKFHAEKGVAFKCDLCRNRDEGPICVEYCPVQALAFVPVKERV